MTTPNPYESLIKKLQNQNLFPTQVFRRSKLGTKVVALELYCNPLQKDIRLVEVREIVGDEYFVDYVSNDQSIIIRRKESVVNGTIVHSDVFDTDV